jgi:hypothetical protein
LSAIHPTRIGVIVVVCAVVGAVVGFAYGAAIALPGAMFEGEVLNGGNRRIFFTGLLGTGPGVLIGLLIGGIAALLVRPRSIAKSGTGERN